MAGVWTLWLLGCGGYDSFIVSVEAELSSDMPTVPLVSWELEEEAEVWIEYGPFPDCDWETHSRTSATGTLPLLGIPPVVDVCYRLVAQLKDSRFVSEEAEIRTGNISATAPGVSVEIFDESKMQPGYLAGSFVIVPSSLFVLNRQGEYVWYKELPEHYTSSQMQLSEQGKGFVYNRVGQQYHKLFAAESHGKVLVTA